PDTIASRTRSRASSRESPDPTPSPPPPLRLSPIAASPNTDPHHPQPKPKPTPSPPTTHPATKHRTAHPVPSHPGPSAENSPEIQTQADQETAEPRPQDPNEPALAQYNEALDSILNDPITDATWLRFLITLDQVMSDTQRRAGIVAGPAPEPRQPLASQNNQSEAKRIQRLYRANRRRAIRVLTNQKHETCPIESDQLAQHFENTWAERNYDPGAYRPSNRPPIDTSLFTQAEVCSRLQKFENTAPGPDKITYENWRKTDPDANTITRILNVCQKHRKIPSTWKKTDTILIYKKDNQYDPTNWRPIALANTLYKLYAGCWATRLTAWLTTQEAVHPAQKASCLTMES
ncbi:hypothetical protein CBL_20522, partial [Carabus blaptoides fortunei]